MYYTKREQVQNRIVRAKSEDAKFTRATYSWYGNDKQFLDVSTRTESRDAEKKVVKFLKAEQLRSTTEKQLNPNGVYRFSKYFTDS